METKNSYSLIEIGLRLRYLVETRAGEKAGATLENINKLESNLVAAGFDVSVAGMHLLKEAKSKLSQMTPEDKLDTTIAKEIADTTYSIERIVYAESSTKKIYILPNRRFNTVFLLSQPNKLLRSGAFERLSNIAQTDLSSAGRCLLFGEATAAAFHVLRATEDVLKQYYFHHRKKERLQKPMWAAMVSQLRAKKSNKPSPVLLDSLDMVRSAYRNPTQHPEATYDIESAQDLFGVCLDLISKMSAELSPPAHA